MTAKAIAYEGERHLWFALCMASSMIAWENTNTQVLEKKKWENLPLTDKMSVFFLYDTYIPRDC